MLSTTFFDGIYFLPSLADSIHTAYKVEEVQKIILFWPVGTKTGSYCCMKSCTSGLTLSIIGIK